VSDAITRRVEDLGFDAGVRTPENVVRGRAGHVDAPVRIGGEAERVVQPMAGAVPRLVEDLGDDEGRWQRWQRGVDDQGHRRVVAHHPVDASREREREGAAGDGVLVGHVDLVVDLGRARARIERYLEVIVERRVATLDGNDHCRRIGGTGTAGERPGGLVAKLDLAHTAEDEAGRRAQADDPAARAERRGRAGPACDRSVRGGKGSAHRLQELADAAEDEARRACGARSDGALEGRARRRDVRPEPGEIPAFREGAGASDRLAHERRRRALRPGLEASGDRSRVGRCVRAGRGERRETEPGVGAELREVDRAGPT
jgi:hypothetical protein